MLRVIVFLLAGTFAAGADASVCNDFRKALALLANAHHMLSEQPASGIPSMPTALRAVSRARELLDDAAAAVAQSADGPSADYINATREIRRRTVFALNVFVEGGSEVTPFLRSMASLFNTANAAYIEAVKTACPS